MIDSASSTIPSIPTTGIAGNPQQQGQGDSGPRPEDAARNEAASANAGGEPLTESDQKQIRELAKRDREVRAHEHAHMAAGSGLVRGGASFTFQRGPDGKNYAVGGEVQIDVSAENDPEQTIRKMQQVKRAALAPTDPSSTDRSVAARAGQIEAKARQETKEPDREMDEDANTSAPGELPAGIHVPSIPGRPPYSVSGLGNGVDVTA